MVRKFDFSLQMRSFFPLFIGFYIPTAALYAVQFVWGTRPAPVGHPFGSAGVSLACAAGVLILYFFFAIPFLRRLIPAVSLEGKPLSFRGSLWPFFGMNLLGLFLSVITLGIYAPWYVTKVARYLAAETSYDGRPWEFTGRPGRLFVILLLTLVLPIVVLTVLLAVLVVAVRGGVTPQAPAQMITQLVTFAVIFLIMPAYTYEFYRWLFINLAVKGMRVRWQTRFWPSVGTILLQMFLTVITLSIYFPAAYVKLYAYFARRTSFDPPEQGGSAYAIGFEGTPARGFGLIWGQTLLSIITVGIYLPWAGDRIGRWFASHTTVSPQSEYARPSSSMAM